MAWFGVDVRWFDLIFVWCWCGLIWNRFWFDLRSVVLAFRIWVWIYMVLMVSLFCFFLAIWVWMGLRWYDFDLVCLVLFGFVWFDWLDFVIWPGVDPDLNWFDVDVGVVVYVDSISCWCDFVCVWLDFTHCDLLWFCFGLVRFDFVLIRVWCWFWVDLSLVWFELISVVLSWFGSRWFVLNCIWFDAYLLCVGVDLIWFAFVV